LWGLAADSRQTYSPRNRHSKSLRSAELKRENWPVDGKGERMNIDRRKILSMLGMFPALRAGAGAKSPL
jgi:hypothetical protein